LTFISATLLNAVSARGFDFHFFLAFDCGLGFICADLIAGVFFADEASAWASPGWFRRELIPSPALRRLPAKP